MKNIPFTKANIIIVLIACMVFLSCKKNAVESDAENPDLPAYTETGSDRGGILINNKPWLTHKLALFSTTRPLQLFSYPAGDSIVLLLNGNYKDSTVQSLNPQTIFVVIKNIRIITDQDLVQLNGKSFVLDGTLNYGGFSEYFGFSKAGKGTGTINFGKVSEISNIT